ncbi:hypothetical protein LX36DRAFT_100653 [Colletotrichum falcatum]|nr:hypothetical protein LX36DRAFT_100653 [Colletotrichum falcatum]
MPTYSLLLGGWLAHAEYHRHVIRWQYWGFRPGARQVFLPPPPTIPFGRRQRRRGIPSSASRFCTVRLCVPIAVSGHASVVSCAGLEKEGSSIQGARCKVHAKPRIWARWATTGALGCALLGGDRQIRLGMSNRQPTGNSEYARGLPWGRRTANGWIDGEGRLEEKKETEPGTQQTGSQSMFGQNHEGIHASMYPYIYLLRRCLYFVQRWEVHFETPPVRITDCC